MERLAKAIETDKEAGEPPILPVIGRFRPLDSTIEVLFRIVSPCLGITKSHISHMVLDVLKWEHSVVFQLEHTPEFIAYARNEHLDFTIFYEWQGVRNEYRPDYLSLSSLRRSRNQDHSRGERFRDRTRPPYKEAAARR